MRTLPGTIALFALVVAAPAAGQVSIHDFAGSRAADHERPTLAVLVVIDQLLPDYLDRYRHQFEGGLDRLLREGAFFPRGDYDHATTETAPGHATTLSGRFPRSTGIVRNVVGVPDPQAPLIGGGGAGASPFRFRGSTLFDWMRSDDPRSRALSVSRKDRGAILPVGRAPQHVYWYALDGRFTTSTYYADTLPSWVTEFNARRLPHAHAGGVWEPLLPEAAYAGAAPSAGSGARTAFPHRLPADERRALALMERWPWIDQITLQFALAGVTALELGAGPQLDLLVVSLSATDAIGHRYGPFTREVHDHLLRLDRWLGEFLDSLVALRGADRMVLALTADHGVAPHPDVTFGPGQGRVDLSDLAADLQDEVRAAGGDPTAVDFTTGILFLDRRRLRPSDFDIDAMAGRFVERARRVEGVLRADRVIDLPRADTAHDVIARRWLHALPPDSHAAAVVTLEPLWYWSPVVNATHGSPHDYDTTVPVLFWGRPFAPGRYEHRIRVVDLAPTLAAALGIEPTEPLDGRPLAEALWPE
jgi:predicted AlkP superfamily pyrophosphatase or phosphodiesterase